MTTVIDTPDLFGYATFCDDIRVEADGKLSYIGVYRGTMFVHGEFPAVLPKFCVGVSFTQKREIFDPNMSLWIFMPGDSDEDASTKIDVTEIAKGAIKGTVEQHAADAGISNPDIQVIQTQSFITFAPFTIKEPGMIRVRILRQDMLHRLGSMRVIAVPTSMAPPGPATVTISTAP